MKNVVYMSTSANNLISSYCLIFRLFGTMPHAISDRKIHLSILIHRAMVEKICAVPNCGKESFQTVPGDLAHKAFPSIEAKGKVHLCKEHYREYKKATKKERELKRMDWV